MEIFFISTNKEKKHSKNLHNTNALSKQTVNHVKMIKSSHQLHF
jgi:hypothetical protein